MTLPLSMPHHSYEDVVRNDFITLHGKLFNHFLSKIRKQIKPLSSPLINTRLKNEECLQMHIKNHDPLCTAAEK
ncbi:CLUMA_CG020563, isoform A [Clunio marinus]|uniref:CLUMA_CG020563, isoform A n=1 Tax=Clunio marinus TaxID=568069 RepID=A0A1J1J7Z3_9DIPT|nr:CLUMA_CG020563, isoform A [Clunio marinus]